MSTANSKTVYIETLGCKLNQADSQALASRFNDAGYRLVHEPEAADVHVVNTCTVTRVADSKARQALRNARKKSPQALVVATGCYPQRAPEKLALLDAVDLVLGNTQKDVLVQRVNDALGLSEVTCATGAELAQQKGPSLRTRAMVKIQEGCNQVCAYCIVPRVRGRERSIHPDTLIREVRALESQGYREVVLTGTQLGSYGFDVPGASLVGLISRVLSETTVPRLRVSSLQPQEITEDLLGLWSSSRLCPHFHVPLQSGSETVLKWMRRRYLPEQYEKAVDSVRSRVPNASITADVIVGFPSETDAMFEETYRLCRRVGFAGLHVFPYSVRPGTSAAHFAGHVQDTLKRQRTQWLLDLAREQAAAFRLGLLGTTHAVLWESSKPLANTRIWSGLTENYVHVSALSSRDLHNQITPVSLERLQGDTVWGMVQ